MKTKIKPQIPPGYKKTEIGIIPEEWEVKRLGKVFTMLKTASYSKADLSMKGNFMYVHYGDIHTKFNSFIDVEKSVLPYIDENKAKGYPLVKEGDLIMVDASEDYEGIGKSVEIKNLGVKKIIAGLHTFLLRDDKKHFVDGFKGFLVHNKAVKKQIETLATGLKVYGISKDNLKEVLLPIPSLPEQRAIARILSDFDALIESLDRLIEKKKNIKKGAMQELLTGKKRLPGFKGEWVRKRLEEIFKISAGGDIDKDHFSPVKTNKYRYPIYSNTIENDGLYGYSDTYEYPKGCITITARGTLGYAIPRYKSFNAIIRLLVLYPNYPVDIKFVSEFINEKINFSVESTGVPQLTAPQIATYSISLPPTFEEQRAIAQILSDMDAEIEALEKKKQKYEMLKKGAMELLLTGKVRLKTISKKQTGGEHYEIERNYNT